MPQSIANGAVVPLDESFLIVGGYNFQDRGQGPLDTIYKYNEIDDSWTLLDTKIPSPMWYAVALMVDLDIFPPCSDEARNNI